MGEPKSDSVEASKTDVEKKKLKVEVWLGISNLVITAIIGIGIAIFLSYREEQAQRQIVALQAEMERQASLAHLEVTTTCLYYTSCDGAIEITNVGPASAENVRVVIAFESIAEVWKPVIEDINSFAVRKFPPGLDIGMKDRTVDVLYDLQMVPGNNAVELSIASLPPDGKFQVLLTLTPREPVKEYEVSIPLTLYIDHSTPQVPSERAIRQYLEERFEIASFSATATCENCEGGPGRISFEVSSLLGWGLGTLRFREAEGGLEWQTQVNAAYWIPGSVNHTPVSSAVHLEVIVPEKIGGMAIREISPPD